MKPYLTTTDRLINWEQYLSLALSAAPEKWFDLFGFKSVKTSLKPVYTPTLQALVDEFGGLGVVLSIPPNTVYPLHVDRLRKGAVNIPLQINDSISMFATARKSGVMYEYEEVEYGPPGTATLFNTQVPHSVLNRSTARLIWSIDFQAKPTFADLVSRYRSFSALKQ